MHVIAAIAAVSLASHALAGRTSKLLDRDVDGASAQTQIACAPVPVPAPMRAGGVAGAPVANFVELDVAPEGDMPRSVAVTPNGQLAVVVNRDTDLMVFVDLAAVQIVATVPIGDYPIDVAVSGDGRYALSTNALDNTVSVVDIATKSLVANVPISGLQPFRILATGDGSSAVVGVINDGVASSFSVIDLNTLTEARSFPSTPQGVIGFFFTPAFAIGGELTTSFDLTPDGSTIVLPWRGGNTVTLYDVATGQTTASISVAAAPSAVDVANDGSIAVVVHDGSPSHVTVIDLASRTAAASYSVTTALDPFIARLSPDAQYVMAAISNNVVFINLATGATTATIGTGTVGDIEVSSDGQYAFVSNFNAAVINVASQTLVKVMPFGACVDAATTAVGNLAVALNNRFREEIYVYTLAGAASSFKGFTLSGPAPEADAPKEIAVSPNGATALVANAVSRNVAFVDLASGAVVATVDTGDVPRESTFTPDGAFALVCNGDSNTLSIIDVATKQVVKTLPTTQRPTRVRVSPDGAHAYVCTIAGVDQLYFIDLAGANSMITSSFAIGQMGAANGYPFSEASGMELSPDGKYLALTISFDNVLRIVDTATHAVVASVPVGNFPIRALFDPSGQRVFVANSFGDDIAVVRHDGALWYTEASISGIKLPLDMALDADGTHLYVGRCDFANPAIVVVDLATNAIVATLPLPGVPREGEYIASRDEYVVTTDDGSLVRISAAGSAASILDVTQISGSAPDMKYVAALDLAVASSPGVPDGLDLVHFGPAAILGDLDGDGDVDAGDIGILLGAWGSVGGPADLDGNGSVGARDLGILLGAWTG